MRQTIGGYMLLALLFVMPAGAVAEDREADRTELLQKLDLIESAINESAFERVVPLLAPDVVIVFLNGEVTRGIDSARTYFEETLGGANAVLSDYETKAEVGAPARFVGDVAIADGTTRDTYEFADGSEMTVDTLWTVTLEKQAGDWKVRQLQFSTNLFDNPLVREAGGRLVAFTGIAAVAGLAIGFGLGRWRRAGA